VNWQYRSILFEFQKDGILGDRYIDNDEMEKVLNEQGGKGWELVSVTPVQEGLVAFVKRPLKEQRQEPVVRLGPGAEARGRGEAEPARQAPRQPAAGQKSPEPRQAEQKKASGTPQDIVGDIKIRS